jgi:hypothetical protein
MTELSTLRLTLLRTAYLVLVVGLGLTIWPTILDPGHGWSLMGGVVTSMLGAMSALALIGLRHPLKMLPLLFFELTWKTIWLLRVALPLWSAGRLDDATTETVYECLLIAIFPFLIPWRYVFATYVKKAGDPWLKRAAA